MIYNGMAGDEEKGRWRCKIIDPLQKHLLMVTRYCRLNID